MKPTWDDVFESAPVLEAGETRADGEVVSGFWVFGDRRVPIVNGVPRFVDNQDYASNFGRQWTEFRLTQLDSHTGLPLSFNRLWNNTRWNPADLRGKLVLEAGSGAGRFTEILLATGARVVSFDLSRAVDANYRANAGKGDLLLCQASLYDMPFKPECFDFVFCHGVLQHTPDPDRSYRELFRMVKPGGRISIDYYLKLDHISEWTTPKYLWRPLTATMDPERLLGVIKSYMPLWLPIDAFIRRIPMLGSWLRAVCGVPCYSYPELPISREEKLRWAIMDTFDALGARYDLPMTKAEVRKMIDLPGAEAIEAVYGGNGVIANARKKGPEETATPSPMIPSTPAPADERLPPPVPPRAASPAGPPLVTVVVPTYNRPDLLGRALESIAAQTHRPLEVIVVNDHGVPAAETVDRFRDRLDITYLEHADNRGLAATRNTALRRARGEYIAYLDDDDRFLPDHVETLVRALRDQGAQIAYADCIRVELEPDGAGGYREARRVVVDIPYDRDRVILRSYLPVQSVMHARACLERTGLFDESLRHREDWDLWMRMCRHYDFLHVPEVTSEYHWKASGPSLSNETSDDVPRVRSYLYAKNADVVGPAVNHALGRLQALERENQRLLGALKRLSAHPLQRGLRALRRFLGLRDES